MTKHAEPKPDELLALLKRVFVLPEHGDRKEESASLSMQRIASAILAPTKPLSVKCKWSQKHSWCAVKYKAEKEFTASRPQLREAKNTLDTLYGTSIEFSIDYTQRIKVTK